MSADRKRYRTVTLTFDVDGLTEGDYADFATNVLRMEREFVGVRINGGWTFTHGWPKVDIRESHPQPEVAG